LKDKREILHGLRASPLPMTRSQPQFSTRERVNRWLLILICGAISLLAMGAAIEVHYFPLTIAIFVLGGFAVTVVHELGHALAARAVGWRVWIFHAAPFAWRRGGKRIRFEGSLGGPDIAGFVLAAPRTAKEDTTFRDVMISAGGPLASWLMAIALIGVAVSAGNVFEDPSEWGATLYALGLLSLVAAVGTTLPVMTVDGEGNDALHIHDKLNYSREKRDHAEVALWLWHYGVDPADWDEDLRASVEAARLHPIKAFVPGFFDFIAALKRGHGAAARGALATFAGVLDNGHAAILEAYLAAAFDGDGAAAEQRLASITSFDGVDESALVFRDLALVEISRLNGEMDEATKRLTNLKVQLGGYAYGRGSIWNELIAAAGARLQSTQTALNQSNAA
jgi:hypothetical protein